MELVVVVQIWIIKLLG